MKGRFHSILYLALPIAFSFFFTKSANRWWAQRTGAAGLNRVNLYPEMTYGELVSTLGQVPDLTTPDSGHSRLVDADFGSGVIRARFETSDLDQGGAIRSGSIPVELEIRNPYKGSLCHVFPSMGSANALRAVANGGGATLDISLSHPFGVSMPSNAGETADYPYEIEWTASVRSTRYILTGGSTFVSVRDVFRIKRALGG